MGFQANVMKVMIASPGDVAVERDIITDELYRWNNANAVSRELILQLVKWETHGSPQMGDHPQAILNERLLLDADIVVGIFGTRIGTATPEFISGSVEEIKRLFPRLGKLKARHSLNQRRRFFIGDDPHPGPVNFAYDSERLRQRSIRSKLDPEVEAVEVDEDRRRISRR
jgi:hypothetical protein